MNPKPQTDTGIHVSLFPEPIIFSASVRHPVFPWNIHHLRSVWAMPVLDKINSDRIMPEYIDKRTGKSFENKSCVERYLGKNIATPWYANEGYHQELKTSFVTAICRRCGYVGGGSAPVTFHGPLTLITQPVSVIAKIACPGCTHLVSADINTEPTAESATNNICDW